MVDKRIGSPEMTVAQMVKQLSTAYTALINSGTQLKKFLLSCFGASQCG